LTAGLYAARARLNTKLIEKLSPGGQVLNTDWVENYPGFPEGISGFELMDKMREQAERFDLDIAYGEVTSLERKGDRVSYCATCDGPFYRDMEVLVVGGGDTAVEEAIFLTRFASTVHLCHRRDELRATGILRERILSEPKVKIHWSTAVNEIEADSNNQVTAAVIKDLKTDKTFKQPVHGVFLFVGTTPATDFLTGFVELNDRGFVKTDLELATSQPGVWATGDVRSKYLRQIATAVGDGATAAYNVEKYIQEKFHSP